MDHHYTLTEIDRMRAAIATLRVPEVPKVTWGPMVGVGSASDLQHERDCERWQQRNEDQLRSYMVNGTTPEELEDRIKSIIAPVIIGSQWKLYSSVVTVTEFKTCDGVIYAILEFEDKGPGRIPAIELAVAHTSRG